MNSFVVYCSVLLVLRLFFFFSLISCITLEEMSLAQDIDEILKDVRPTKIILLAAGALGCGQVLITILEPGDIIGRFIKLCLSGVRKIANPIIRREVVKASQEIKLRTKEGELKTYSLPEKGAPANEVLTILNTFHNDLDIPFQDGGLSGAVYHGGFSHTEFMNKVMNIFQWSNPLHSDVFGATRKMEAEVVSMVLHMFHGHLLPDGCGALTSGGSESIVMAMKAYRDWGRAHRGVRNPSVLAPITIHPAFDKAAEYFKIKLIKVPVRPETMTVDANVMEKYIRPDTVAIVGSACSFPHGAIDPIEELSDLALKYNIGLHVDSCLGGFILPFLPYTGRKLPVCDFRLPGVTSISCDTHKYGYAPKGTSTILYRSKKLRSYQFCSVSEWPGGMYCSPGVSGSKPGNVIAATWASMVNLGLEGYIRCADEIVRTREFISSEIAKVPYLYVYGEPQLSVFAFGTCSFDIFEMGSELMKRGWMLNRLQFPSGLQFSLTLLQVPSYVAERFVRDVKEVGDQLYAAEQKAMVESNRTKPKTGDQGGSVYGTAQRVPDRTIIKDVLNEYLNVYYTP